MITTSPTTAVSHRPVAHFTTRDTWLNDPNGLLYYEGTYHLFYQTNPHGSTWGNISWGHATSTDLVAWTEHDIAIPFTADEMAFSGSAVVDVRNTAGFAGPGQTAFVAVYTSARPPRDDEPASQSQSLAYSLDEGQTWNRYEGNPVLDIGSSEFRDPKVFWHGSDDGHWVMVAVEAVARRVVIYTSPDLISWTRASHFGPAHATDGVWECPDLFPLSVAGTKDTRWVLIVSMNPGGIAGGSGTQYFVGDFDGTTFTADRLIESDDPTTYDWLDYGRDYYAAVSFNDVPDGRRLMIGWASNWDYANETPTHPWRSAMSLAREVTLVPDEEGIPRIHQRPVLPQDSSALTSFTVTVPCAPGDRQTLVLSAGGEEHLAITVDGDHRSITSDRTRSGATDFHPTFPSIDRAPLPGADTTEVELFVVVDATIVEIYVDGGRVTLTEQVFPSEPFTQLRVEGEARVGRA
ncbi:glycoside hydrolase family 32 protein [Microbacterium memoriense]|uniref:Glycoside hydrolase family 32 protein n=1 Tax=Microbacterium memoriense TaxID=2978350 RepID=A0ABT2PDT2_9MICO|nr:glycoside hydrolase family 32 protein [Microbacterium memoriense]MCT9002362.1 glycoside hydrolase family 32 protein [Microbacterium memoriense]